jgi:hypothetical protein
LRNARLAWSSQAGPSWTDDVIAYD